jgi:anaerobic magnesium-protoporphyrin IX monomethyl ester cyclase
MKVMLVDPSLPAAHGYEVVFPFGYASMGAVLQHEGHEVEYLVPAANGLDVTAVTDYVSNSDTDLVAMGGLLPYLPTVIELIGGIKAIRPNMRIVVGGQMVTYTPELVLKKTDADFCIRGEGEVALLKLVDCLQNGKDYLTVPGLVFAEKDGQIVSNGLGETMPLEDIPMPNWDNFPMHYYMYAGSRPHISQATGVTRHFTWLLSRGCPMKCNFCASTCSPRYKTVDQSVLELREIVDRFHPDYITFADNLFTRTKKYVTELCEAFIDNRFCFRFSVSGRADVVDRQLLALMRKAGCQAIFYGLECANNRILKFMEKGITMEQMREAIEATKEAEIYPMVSIMFGQPGETFDDFFNSLYIALTCIDSRNPALNLASVMPLLTFPGTQIYRYAREHGYFTSDEDYWHKYSGDFRIQYDANKYTNEAVGEVVDIANTISRWKYHQSMADGLLKSLRRRRSSYRGFPGILNAQDQKLLCRFLDRSLTELIG